MTAVQQVLGSGLFSPRWYAATTGSAFDTPAEAAADYVQRAASGRRRFAPHPLFSRLWVAAQGAPTPPGRDPLTNWLDTAADRTSPHPLLPVGVPADDGADLVERCLAGLAGFRAGDVAGRPGPRDQRGPRAVLGATGTDLAVVRTLAGLVAAGGWQVEVRAGDAAPELAELLVTCSVLADAVRVRPEPWAPEDADVLVAPGVATVPAADLGRLLDAAGPGPAQPVVLDDAGLVASAGAGSGLVGRHPRDLVDLGTVAVAALASPVVARWPGAGAPVLVGGVAVEAGSSEPITSAPRGEVPAPAPRVRVHEGRRTLRWTIDTACVYARRERWGDWHFARSLAAALERLGQHVAVDAREARERASRERDDVVLVLRGLDPVRPTPGPASLLWVISHPDEVTADEARAFDRVFAASLSWSHDRSGDWGLPVTPLLQCTDTSRFHLPTDPQSTGDDLLYVANARPDPRRMLTWAREAGLRLDVHGSGWGDRLPVGWLRSTWVDNERLGERYAAARAVLNDHHPDMAADGFVANRLFDAVATGAVVLSDPVPGLAELFGDAVVAIDSADDLARVTGDLDRHAPSAQSRHRAAEAVAARHSFDARAAALLDAALALR